MNRFLNKRISLSFDLQTTLLLKTICCFVIALHHYSLNQIYVLRTISDGNIFSKLGFIAVGLFFFLSAYGNTVSFKKDISFIISLRKKLINIFLPYIFAHLFFLILFCIFIPGYDYNKHILDVFLFNGPFWFLKVLLLFLIITEIANRNIDSKWGQVLFLGIALSAYYYFNLSNEGYLRLSTYAYLFGFLFANIKNISVVHFISIVVVLFAITFMGYLYCKELGQVCICSLNCCLVSLVMRNFPLRKYIPKIANHFSYFVYLSHMYFIIYFTRYDLLSILGFLMVVSVSSVILSFLYVFLLKIVAAK